MHKYLLAFVSILVLSLFTGCSQAGTGGGAVSTNANSSGVSSNANSQPVKALPEDVVRVEAVKVEAQAGKQAEASVQLKIKEGYHINANPPSQYQIATQLTIEPQEGITAGQPVYPASITKKFAFAEQPLAVYENEARINVPLTVAGGAAKGERTLPARLRFQACDEQVCYPPKNIQTQIPLLVK